MTLTLELRAITEKHCAASVEDRVISVSDTAWNLKPFNSVVVSLPEQQRSRSRSVADVH